MPAVVLVAVEERAHGNSLKWQDGYAAGPMLFLHIDMDGAAIGAIDKKGIVRETQYADRDAKRFHVMSLLDLA